MRKDGIASGAPPLHAQILEQLGSDIVRGSLPQGQVVTIEALESKYGASRSIIREILKVLESKGMISSRRRVGIVVRPFEQWTLYDPAIIRWRLDSDHRRQQLQSLVELRLAVEPEAARVAAARASVKHTSNLMSIAAKLWAAGSEGRTDKFIELDVEYHRVLLQASGNEMFAVLDSIVGATIAGRAAHGLMPEKHSELGLQMHVDVATAIQARNETVAHDSMRQIIRLIIEELNGSFHPEIPTVPQ